MPTKKTSSATSATPARTAAKSPTIAARPAKTGSPAKKLTGRLLLRLDPSAGTTAIERRAKAGGLRLANIRDFSAARTGGVVAGALEQADGLVLENLKIAILHEKAADRVSAWRASAGNYVLAMEPERVLRAVQAGERGRGFGGGAGGGAAKKSFRNTSAATWGIHAIGVLPGGHAYTGKGVKIAILDTGMDFTHPDWAGRTLHRKSFVGRQAIDQEGHGTLCAGIAGGGRKQGTGARYGVAPGAQLYIGKILDEGGEGSDGTALAGIDWALEKGCRVISLSLGAEAGAGEPFSGIFEAAARTALQRNCLLIAAAGNESDREEGHIAPVNHPANCPSILAVGALTEVLEVAAYSNAGGAEATGQVDLAAPGEHIVSCKRGGGYRSESGTSMATPFAAGVAALLWEQAPKASAAEIWMQLVQQARRLALPATDIGAGLVYLR